jgi:hypothetical protein
MPNPLASGVAAWLVAIRNDNNVGPTTGPLFEVPSLLEFTFNLFGKHRNRIVELDGEIIECFDRIGRPLVLWIQDFDPRFEIVSSSHFSAHSETL